MDSLEQRAEEVQELAAKATPGPWFQDDDTHVNGPDGKSLLVSGPGERAETWVESDALFIAHCHQMAALIKEQQEEIERLRMELILCQGRVRAATKAG